MFLSAVWWLTVFSELAGSVSCPSCSVMHAGMGLRKHGLTHWDPRSTGLANELIDPWQVHKKLPPYLAYILWNCSGVDGNNLKSILVITWHRQTTFQIQYGIFSVNSDEVKQTEQDIPTPVKDHPGLVILFPPPPPPPPPSAVYMRRWIGSALIRVMVSRLFGAKPLPEPVLTFIINWTLGGKLQWNCNWNSNTFIEDRFENVVCNFHIINGNLYSYLICIWSGDV